MILPIFNALDDLDENIVNASKDLGANDWQTFTKIIFPLSLNGVRSGVQSVFIPSLSLFMLTRLIGGNRVITLGTAIEQHFLTTQNWGMGATQGQMLREVMLPYLTPGIIAGYFMAFTYSLDDFAVTFFVTGNGFSTLAVEIYSRARKGISLEINALSTVVFLFSILLVIGYYMITQERKEEHDA
jgi:spermidine/putrescine transport system permease protein